MIFSKKLFGYVQKKQPIFLYHLENAAGAYIEVLGYGCRIHSICVPNKEGKLRDVCLGYATLAEYEKDSEYLGAAVGRCCNLISGANFSLHRQHYFLDTNSGCNHLHGGQNGFSFLQWDCTPQENKLIFSRSIPHLSDGYPGNLKMQITYQWTEDNCLNICYEGICDTDTILNVTNHTYFNLNGTNTDSTTENTIINHELHIHSRFITEVREDLLPTGCFLPVEHTPFDFRKLKLISKDIVSDNMQIVYGEGYDHCFLLEGKGFRKAATLQSRSSGIRMTCYTDQPGIQIYTANGLTPRPGKYGETLLPRSGICLETQHFTDAVHIPAFPSVVLPAGEQFLSRTTYCFDTLKL